MSRLRHFNFAIVLVAIALFLAACGAPAAPAATTGTLAVTVNQANASVTVTGPNNYSQTFTGNRELVVPAGTYSARATFTGFNETSGSTTVAAGGRSALALNMTAITPGPVQPGPVQPGPVQPGPVPPAPDPGRANLVVVVRGAMTAPVRVTGPSGFDQSRNVTSSANFTNLEPGTYTVMGTAVDNFTGPGAAQTVTIAANTVETVTLNYVSMSVTPERVGPYYRTTDNRIVRISDADFAQPGRFVFYSWLEDRDAGINPAIINNLDNFANPGAPTLAEQDEIAPSFTQNLAAAFIGYRADDGNIYPIMGGEVKWVLDPFWTNRVGSMMFTASSDGTNADCRRDGELTPMCITAAAQQADTTTQNSRTMGLRFPNLDQSFPFYNATGVASPNLDGFSWVTLFSPDARAHGRILVTGSVNGIEVGKAILFKRFAPQPQLSIVKTVAPAVTEPNQDVQFTVVIRNSGAGDATNVVLHDRLESGNDATYSITGPAGSAAVGDSGFNLTIPVIRAGEERVITFPARASAVGQYCNIATIVAADNEEGAFFRNQPPLPISDNACFTVVAPTLNIVKEFVDAAGNSLGSERTVEVGQAARLRVTIGNTGTGTARGINLTDRLTTANDATYSITQPEGATLVGDSGFNVPVFELAPGASRSFIFDATATADGRYCDLAAYTSDNAGAGQDDACLNVITPADLRITKTVTPNVTEPGAPVTFTVTVTNNGRGNASNIRMTDRLVRGNEAAYSITAPAGTTAVGDSGFDFAFDLAAGASRTFTFPAVATAIGEYCNQAMISEFTDSTGRRVVNLMADACFNVVAPTLTIEKVFVATGTNRLTTIGNDPAVLRVTLRNSGTGVARAVNVTDRLISGNAAAYSITQLPAGARAVGDDGFDDGPFDLAPGAVRTFDFTVVANQDGEYCDRAAFTSANAGTGQADACLVIETPRLVITKTNAPTSVLPTRDYTSTITVTNNGNAAARGVVISDRIGQGPTGVFSTYVSSTWSIDGSTGVYNSATETVTFPAIDILPGQSVIVNVTQRIPPGTMQAVCPAGFVNIARFVSVNAGTGEAQACVNVPAFAALQTELVDNPDPAARGEILTYSSVLLNEQRSNESVNNQVITYSFGVNDPLVNGVAGVFVQRPPAIFLYADATNPDGTLRRPIPAGLPQLVDGVDYTLTTNVQGLQVITLAPGYALAPRNALVIEHQVDIPAGVAPRQYHTTFSWTTRGVQSGEVWRGSSSEPTTIQ